MTLMPYESNGKAPDNLYNTFSRVAAKKRAREQDASPKHFICKLRNSCDQHTRGKINFYEPAHLVKHFSLDANDQKCNLTDERPAQLCTIDAKAQYFAASLVSEMYDRTSLECSLSTTSSTNKTKYQTIMPCHLVRVKLTCGDTGKHAEFTARVRIKRVCNFHDDIRGVREPKLLEGKHPPQWTHPLVSVHEKVRMEVLHKSNATSKCRADTAVSSYSKNYTCPRFLTDSHFSGQGKAAGCVHNSLGSTSGSDSRALCNFTCPSLFSLGMNSDNEDTYSYFYESSCLSLRESSSVNSACESCRCSCNSTDDCTRDMIFDCLMKCALEELSVSDQHGWTVVYRGRNMCWRAERDELINDLLNPSSSANLPSLFFFRKH